MPTWVTPSPAWPAAPPPQARRPGAPPIVAPPPPRYAASPTQQPRPAPPPRGSKSGCGCLLALLIVVGMFITIGRVGSHRSAPQVRPSPLSVDVQSAAHLPSRPLGMFTPSPSHDGAGAFLPFLQDCTVKQVAYTGTPHYQLTAHVAPGSERRVLLAVFAVDSDGQSVKDVSKRHSNRQGALAAGAWVSGGGHSGRSQSIQVELKVPTSVAETPPAWVQFSLFNENNTELARWNVALPSDQRSPADAPYSPSR